MHLSHQPSALGADDDLPSFARGVLAIVDAWPAFRIAREQHLNAAEGSEARLHLATELVDAFTGSIPPPAAELADFLCRFMEGECGLGLEDGSEAGIARDLLALWSLPSGAPRDAFGERLAGHAKAHRGAPLYRSVDQDGNEVEDENSDDKSSDGEGDAAMDIDGAPDPPPPNGRKREPVVDDDGFTLVRRR